MEAEATEEVQPLHSTGSREKEEIALLLPLSRPQIFHELFSLAEHSWKLDSKGVWEIWFSSRQSRAREGKGMKIHLCRILLSIVCVHRGAPRRGAGDSSDHYFTNNRGREIFFGTHKKEVADPGLALIMVQPGRFF